MKYKQIITESKKDDLVQKLVKEIKKDKKAIELKKNDVLEYLEHVYKNHEKTLSMLKNDYGYEYNDLVKILKGIN